MALICDDLCGYLLSVHAPSGFVMKLLVVVVMGLPLERDPSLVSLLCNVVRRGE